MHFQFSHRLKFVWLPLLALAVGFGVGCGGDSGGDPKPEPTCAISAVNTGLEDSWLTDDDDVSIRWTQNGVPSTVDIALLKGGQPVATIATGTANDGFFSWTQISTGGQDNGSDFGIRVTGAGVASCSSEVNDLTITDVNGCAITFTAALDTMHAGDTFDITWTGFHTSGSVDIELWTSSFGNELGRLVGTVAMGAVDNGSYNWTVDSFHNSADYAFYRFVIRDPGVPDCETASDQFAIIDDEICEIGVFGPPTEPSWDNGDQMLITFTASNSSGVVNLRLYAGNEWVPGGIIADNVNLVDGYMWTVSDFGFTTSSTSYNIRAADAADGYCIGESDRFTINP